MALNSWCWAQRGHFVSLPRYFRQNGYVTAGGGKVFHPDGCNQYPDPPDGNKWMHPAYMYYGTMGNYSHWEVRESSSTQSSVPSADTQKSVFK